MRKLTLLISSLALLAVGTTMTSCVKSDESASVENVRNAKALQLQALAALSNAQAEMTLLKGKADAALQDANTALVLINNKLAEAQNAQTIAALELEKQETIAQLAADLWLYEKEAELRKLDMIQFKANMEALIAASHNVKLKVYLDTYTALVTSGTDVVIAIPSVGVTPPAPVTWISYRSLTTVSGFINTAKTDLFTLQAGVTTAESALATSVATKEYALSEANVVLASLEAFKTAGDYDNYLAESEKYEALVVASEDEVNELTALRNVVAYNDVATTKSGTVYGAINAYKDSEYSVAAKFLNATEFPTGNTTAVVAIKTTYAVAGVDYTLADGSISTATAQPGQTSGAGTAIEMEDVYYTTFDIAALGSRILAFEAQVETGSTTTLADAEEAVADATTAVAPLKLEYDKKSTALTTAKTAETKAKATQATAVATAATAAETLVDDTKANGDEFVEYEEVNDAVVGITKLANVGAATVEAIGDKITEVEAIEVTETITAKVKTDEVAALNALKLTAEALVKATTADTKAKTAVTTAGTAVGTATAAVGTATTAFGTATDNYKAASGTLTAAQKALADLIAGGTSEADKAVLAKLKECQAVLLSATEVEAYETVVTAAETELTKLSTANANLLAEVSVQEANEALVTLYTEMADAYNSGFDSEDDVLNRLDYTIEVKAIAITVLEAEIADLKEMGTDNEEALVAFQESALAALEAEYTQVETVVAQYKALYEAELKAEPAE